MWRPPSPVLLVFSLARNSRTFSGCRGSNIACTFTCSLFLLTISVVHSSRLGNNMRGESGLSPPASESPVSTDLTEDPGPRSVVGHGRGLHRPLGHSVSCQPEMTASVSLQTKQKASMRSSLRFMTHIRPRHGLRFGRRLHDPAAQDRRLQESGGLISEQMRRAA
jgi:hypothetical protein